MSHSSSAYTQKGIAAFKAGNRHLARQYFEMALAENPDDVQGWLWMSGVVNTSAEKRDCLRRVLVIDPTNAHAKRGLELLGPEPSTPFISDSPGLERTPAQTEIPPAAQQADVMPRPPAESPHPRRRRPNTLIVALSIAAVSVVIVSVVLVLSQARTAPAALPTQPVATSIRPPTWTPQPTATVRPTPTPRPAPTQLQPLIEEAMRLRELEPMESIHYVLSSQFDLDLYLRNDLDNQSVVTANTFWEEMRALGLVSFDAKYDRQQLIDATSQQLGGFYSPADKTLYAVTRSSRVDPSEYTLIVHEYTHALTDMHFDLTRLYRFGNTTTDADLAARALGEGDATLVENSSPWSNFGPKGWEDYAHNVQWAAPLFRQSGVSPALLYIQFFPYVEGWQFVWTLRASGGWDRVNAAYNDIPVSTEQILHPEKYLTDADDVPIALSLPAIETASAGDGDLVVANDTLGEFVLSLMLDDFIDDAPRAAQAAAGWGGDALRVWRDGVGRPTYVLLTAWDTLDDAREFLAAGIDMLNARSKGAAPAASDLERAYFEGEGGTAYISRNNDQVLIIWSPDAALRDELLDFFPDF